MVWRWARSWRWPWAFPCGGSWTPFSRPWGALYEARILSAGEFSHSRTLYHVDRDGLPWRCRRRVYLLPFPSPIHPTHQGSINVGTCTVIDQGNLDPAYTESQPARLEVVPQDGILKRIDVYFTGTHVTAATAQEDGESNIFSALRVEIPRRRMPNVIFDILPRDAKWLTAILEGSLSEHLNPTADGGAHQGRFSLFLAPPRRLTPFFNDYGLDTNELSGPIQISVLYNSVTSIGGSATAITNATRISTCVEDRAGVAPSFILSANQNRVDHISDARLGPTTLGTSNLERLAGMFLRQHDDSGTATERVDGLITRFIIRHRGLDIQNELFMALKQRTAQLFGFDRADYPDGIALPLFAETWDPSDMLDLEGGNTLKIIHDSIEALPDGVTDIPPATSDAFYAIMLGMQLTAEAAGVPLN